MFPDQHLADPGRETLPEEKSKAETIPVKDHRLEVAESILRHVLLADGQVQTKALYREVGIVPYQEE